MVGWLSLRSMAHSIVGSTDGNSSSSSGLYSLAFAGSKHLLLFQSSPETKADAHRIGASSASTSEPSLASAKEPEHSIWWSLGTDRV
ncbi:unnamed protein product [Protopolystoma xenopodis]|uniref:Uncharacterized protein n=1 Tax=Protopolystoma xenopodis TaxID=117903 RepID=A0A3S5B2D4_9PLAT|nr:unnamed protein product [Protopolystoma xenopodis]